MDDWACLVGDDGGGQETGADGVVQVSRSGGPEGEGVCKGKQGAAGDETDKEVTGKVSADGEGDN